MMAVKSRKCTEESAEIEAPAVSRRASARIKDKQRAEKELLVRRRVELLEDKGDVVGGASRGKRIKHCYIRRRADKNAPREEANGEVEKSADAFEMEDKPMSRSSEAENRTVRASGAPSTSEKSDYAKVKDTLRVFNKYYLHFVQEEEKRCGKAEAEAEAEAETSKASKSKKGAARQDKKLKPSKGSKSKIQTATEDTKSRAKRPDLKAASKASQDLKS